MAGLVALALLVSSPLLSIAGQGGQIRGKVAGFEKLVPDVNAEAADPKAHRYSWREPSPTVAVAARILAGNPSREICVAAFSTDAPKPAEAAVLVKVAGGRTIPATIVVAPSTVLSFKNFDPFPHRLFQLTDGKPDPKWAPQVTLAMATRDWRAQSPGHFEIRDELFSSVRMHIVVDPNVIGFVYPARDGAFTMNLPPGTFGTFTLKAFFGGRQVGKDLPGLTLTEKTPTLELKDAFSVGGETP